MINTHKYREEIMNFFMGKNYYEDYEKGHIWVCHHKGFDTLTIEPLDGGQYEVAVRIPQQTLDGVMWAGYWVDPHGYLHGVNTNGH
jgi:hypothetical protein